jgi:septum formation protein
MENSPRRRIVLASRSPRRLDLARNAGWDVVLAPPPPEAEGSAPPKAPSESLEAYVLRLARAKAAAVATTGVTGTILACDTLSEVDGQPLGQAADRDAARRMLETLSGKRHRVVTGVCVWHRPELDAIEATDESELEMGPLDPLFLDWYLASGLWKGKAGACGYQDERLPLRLIQGSATNVVGLPMELIGRMLEGLDRQLPQR